MLILLSRLLSQMWQRHRHGQDLCSLVPISFHILRIQKALYNYLRRNESTLARTLFIFWNTITVNISVHQIDLHLQFIAC